MSSKTLTGMEIAVIGMSGQFPGAKNINEFWQNLLNSEDNISRFSKEELLESGISEKLINNERYVPAKGILENADQFDADFFGYSPLEASLLDPQTRLMHQCAWHTLEDAGYDSFKYTKRIGLYAGASANPVWQLVGQLSDMGSVAQFLSDKDYMCTRIANKLNFKGPATFVQTACSTSLVSVHMACRALLTGECEIALAGGVSLKLPQKTGYMYQEGMICSSDGYCRSFDASASGTVSGEGVGLVLLKPLKKALSDNDNIYCVIKGSAVNNDGKNKVGYTAPSVEGQANVIKNALRVAKVNADSIGFVEAHGTGTQIGDPIEVEALSLVYNSLEKEVCVLGSVKSNIGHLDQAAGIAGFIKACLAVKEGTIPGTKHFRVANTELELSKTPFYISHSNIPFCKGLDEVRRAATSSFGVGGTNAHIIIEEYSLDENNDKAVQNCEVFFLSAKSKYSLSGMVDNLASFLSTNKKPLLLSDIAYTLNEGRHHFTTRKAFVSDNVEDLISQLVSYNNNKDTAKVSTEKQSKIVFLFPGQGCQFIGMGKELYELMPEFTEQLDCCLDTLTSLSGENYKDILFSSNSDMIQQTKYAQPLIFALEYSLAKILILCGLKPDAMIGHSLGEYVAACLSNVFSLRDALWIILKRSNLMQAMDIGCMISINLSYSEVKKYLHHDLSVAAINTNNNVVLSGSNVVMDELFKNLKDDDVSYRKLPTSHAFHSSMMEPLLDSFCEELSKIKIHAPSIPYISNLTGDWVTEKEVKNSSYWAKHLRHTVLYSDGIEKLLTLGGIDFVEVGPGKTLSNFIKKIASDMDNTQTYQILPNVNDRKNDLHYLKKGLGDLWANGQKINLSMFKSPICKKLSLPKYVFHPTSHNISIPNDFESIQTMKNFQKTSPVGERISFIDEVKYQENEQLSDIERKVLRIFTTALGIKNITPSESFFDLGGDSLVAMSVLSNIFKNLNVDIKISEFFEQPSVISLAKVIEGKDKVKFNPVLPAKTKEYYSLSPAQKRLFVVQGMDKKSTGYNETMVVEIQGELDINLLEKSFVSLIERHEILRTHFSVIENEPVQVINESVNFKINHIKSDKNTLKTDIKHFIQPLTLQIAPLLRVGIFSLKESRNIMALDIHHIIIDGTSMGLLINEILKTYNQIEVELPKLHYKDFSEWQNSKLEQERIKNQGEYWKKQFGNNAVPVLELPTDFPRSALRKFEGSSVSFHINTIQTKELKSITSEYNVSLFMVLFSVFSVLIGKISGQQDITIGTAVAGRKNVDLEKVLGMFVNMLALRSFPEKELTLKEFLLKIKNNVLEAFEHQEFQYEDLVDELNLKRDTSRNALFDVVFVLQNMSGFNNSFSEESESIVNFKPYEQKSSSSKFDITLTAMEYDDQIGFTLEYSSKLFKEETIKMYTESYKEIIQQFIKSNEIKIRDVKLSDQFNTIEEIDLSELDEWL